MASLSPMYTIGNQLIEAIRAAPDMEQARRPGSTRSRCCAGSVSRDRSSAWTRTPFQLSGGMCQRAMIAMALSCGAVAADRRRADDRARRDDAGADPRPARGPAAPRPVWRCMFITHDLGVVAEIADEVVVMYLGTVVEQRHRSTRSSTTPNTRTPRRCCESIPTIGSGTRQRLTPIRGMVPHPSDRPTGCPFHPRCDQRDRRDCATSPTADRSRPGPGHTRPAACCTATPSLTAGSAP